MRTTDPTHGNATPAGNFWGPSVRARMTDAERAADTTHELEAAAEFERLAETSENPEQLRALARLHREEAK